MQTALMNRRFRSKKRSPWRSHYFFIFIVGCCRQWRHGEVNVHHLPQNPGGMYADSEPYIQRWFGDTDSTGISSSCIHQTPEGIFNLTHAATMMWFNLLKNVSQKTNKMFSLCPYNRLNLSTIQIITLQKGRLLFSFQFNSYVASKQCKKQTNKLNYWN